MSDPTEIAPEEFHPAARSAYRWLKGFMVSNSDDYLKYRTALSMAAETGNRQAQICMGTIRRLRAAQPVSDRYLLGLAWTILSLHNHDAIEAIAEKRIDPAYGPDEAEYKVTDVQPKGQYTGTAVTDLGMTRPDSSTDFSNPPKGDRRKA